jgi:hypothetical protein
VDPPNGEALLGEVPQPALLARVVVLCTLVLAEEVGVVVMARLVVYAVLIQLVAAVLVELQAHQVVLLVVVVLVPD